MAQRMAQMLATVALIVCVAGEANAQEGHAVTAGEPAVVDSLAVVAAVRRFHAALRAGDSTTVLRLLAGDAEVLESGGRETRAEYRSHHLGADIEFVQAVRSTVRDMRATVRGDVAWVTSTSESAGTFRKSEINSVGAELMVLSRTSDGWQIRAIHWSSARRRAPS